MKTDLKEINSYTRQLDVTVEWNSIENEYQEEFNKARSGYNIPGFRKGKVPEKIVKKNLGPVIDANFAENSLNNYYRKALEKLDITPINKATINNLNFQEGLDLSFTAQFEVVRGTPRKNRQALFWTVFMQLCSVRPHMTEPYIRTGCTRTLNSFV